MTAFTNACGTVEARQEVFGPRLLQWDQGQVTIAVLPLLYQTLQTPHTAVVAGWSVSGRWRCSACATCIGGGRRGQAKPRHPLHVLSFGNSMQLCAGQLHHWLWAGV